MPSASASIEFIPSAPTFGQASLLPISLPRTTHLPNPPHHLLLPQTPTPLPTCPIPPLMTPLMRTLPHALFSVGLAVARWCCSPLLKISWAQPLSPCHLAARPRFSLLNQSTAALPYAIAPAALLLIPLPNPHTPDHPDPCLTLGFTVT
jgi:hypothetical protein